MTLRHRFHNPSTKTDSSTEKRPERRRTINEFDSFRTVCTKSPTISNWKEELCEVGRKSSSLILPLISVPLFGCILYLLLHYLLYFDLNKRVYNHVPGECSYLGGAERGVGDVQLVNNHTLIASSGFDINNASNSTGGILLWRLNEHESKILELKTSKSQPKTKFNPYGISYVMGILFAVNLRKPLQNTDTVEILRVEDRALQRVRLPVRSPMFTSLCDVQGIDASRFYATNSFHYRHTALQMVEFTIHKHTASLLYFDGKQVHRILDGLGAGIGGLGIQQKRLYMSIFGRDEIRVYTMGTDPKILDLKEVIPVHSAPHFFHLEPKLDSFLVATHPNKLKFLLQRQWPYDYFAPSQVLHFQKSQKTNKWRVTQMYANDGATLSGASIAAFLPDNRLVIGDIKHGLLRCALTSV